MLQICPRLHRHGVSRQPKASSTAWCLSPASHAQLPACTCWVPRTPRQLLPSETKLKHVRIRSVRTPAGGKSEGNGNPINGGETAGTGNSGSTSSSTGSDADIAADASVNGGSGSGSSGNGGSKNGGSRQSPGDGPGSRGPGVAFDLPFSFEQLSYAVLTLAVVTAGLLVAVARQRALIGMLDKGADNLAASMSGMADGPSTRDSVSAIKRLLREVFAEQLALKQRLADAESAATAASQLQAADDYRLQQALGSAARWSRAPVRMSGHITAAGVLPWAQGANPGDALDALRSLGGSGVLDARFQVHSVLAGGKRHITAELCQAEQPDGGTALSLNQVLFRAHVNKWLKLLIAPLGGSLEALGRSVVPVRGDFGCTQEVRQGHGLSALQHQGSGKAIALSSRNLSAAAGFFVQGATSTGVAHLQARTQGGSSLSVAASHCKTADTGTTAGSSSSSSHPHHPSGTSGWRFLGVQSPSRSARCNMRLSSGPVIGAAGVLALTDAYTASAWAEKPSAGHAGWGFGLFCQPDPDGLELALALGRPSSSSQPTSRPMFCEVSAKVPAGEGLSISPCALVTYSNGASSLAYVMQSCWRW